MTTWRSMLPYVLATAIGLSLAGLWLLLPHGAGEDAWLGIYLFGSVAIITLVAIAWVIVRCRDAMDTVGRQGRLLRYALLSLGAFVLALICRGYVPEPTQTGDFDLLVLSAPLPLVLSVTLVYCVAGLFLVHRRGRFLNESRRKEYEKAYAEIFDFVEKNHLFRDGMEEFALRRTCYPEQWLTDWDAEYSILLLLAALGDRYTYLIPASMREVFLEREDASGSVDSDRLMGSIGLLRLKSFVSRKCVDEMYEAAYSLSDAQSYILDLRGNGGGLLETCLRIYSLFVESGTLSTDVGYKNGSEFEEVSVVTTEECRILSGGVNGEIRERVPRLPNILGDKPVVVLVDGDSASASESLAGALRGRKNTVIVGLRTFGKGVGQLRFTSSNGVNVFTTYARFFLPDGVCPHEKGIDPDVEVEGREMQLYEAMRIAVQMSCDYRRSLALAA